MCSATIGANVALQGKTILVVEDDALIGILLTDFLSAEGAIVLGPVTNVSEALECVKRRGFDIATIDVLLKDGICFPVADKLIQLGIPFIFITAYPDTEIKSSYLRLPKLLKPFKLQDLSDKIDFLLTKG